MPFSIPSRADLQQQILADAKARITGADTSLRRSTIRIIAFLLAGGLWFVYRFIAWLAKQLFVDSAEGAYLERRLAAYGIVRLGPTLAAGNVIFSGTVGFDIPINTELETSDGTVQFATQADATVGGGGTVTVAIEALIPGSAGNALAGAPLNLTTAIAGIQPVANVDSSGLSGGTDAETDASLRTRGQARIQKPPQGGAGPDYVAWAKLVAGVTRVWVYPLNRGAGTVDIMFVMDGRTSNIPLSGDIANVQASINTFRPVTADALALAPTADTLTVTITNLVPNTSDMQAAIQAQLLAFARTVPAGSATIGDGVTTAVPGGSMLNEQIVGAIRAAGPTGFDLTAPTGDTTFALGHVPGVWTVTIT